MLVDDDDVHFAGYDLFQTFKFVHLFFWITLNDNYKVLKFWKRLYAYVRYSLL